MTIAPWRLWPVGGSEFGLGGSNSEATWGCSRRLGVFFESFQRRQRLFMGQSVHLSPGWGEKGEIEGCDGERRVEPTDRYR